MRRCASTMYVFQIEAGRLPPTTRDIGKFVKAEVVMHIHGKE